MDEHAVFDVILSAASFTVALVGQFSVYDAMTYISNIFLFVSMLMLFMKIWPDEICSIDHTSCDKALAPDDCIGVLTSFCV
jgi:hypothetical protein